MGRPVPEEPPIYVACYVNDLIYWSPSDTVESHFEARLASRLHVDFLGPVSWYLGVYYKWACSLDGALLVHLS